MSRFFTASVAMGALAAMLAGPVLAQDAPAAPPAAEAPASVTLPQVLRDAGLTDVDSKPGRHGTRIQGKLADGTELGAFLDGKGELRGLRAKDDAVLPQSLIEALVPQPVRGQAIFGEFARLDAIFNGPEGIALSGQDAQGKALRAGFAADGTLMRFGRGEPERPRMGDMRPGGSKGPHGEDHGRGGPDGKGPRHEGKGPRDHDRDGDRDHDRDGDRRGDRDRRGPAPQGDPLTPDQVRASLTDAGYTEVAEILQQGPITIARATNPEGEPVLVEVGVDGKILRELNR